MKKLKNNILFKNIFILLISGSFAKIIGMFGKIMYTRIAGITVVSLYTIIMPTLMLIISITQFSFPISISKLSAEDKYKNNSLIKNAYFIGFMVDILLIIILLLSSGFIASLLHNKALSIVIRSTILIIPFVTISSIQRGFLHGKENMLPASVTNITEEIVKILLIIFLLPIAVLKNDITAVIFLILFNVITETISIIIMNKVIKNKYVTNIKSKLDFKIIKEINDISIPTTLIRLISSVGFFLEPIILTNVLLGKGFNINYITIEYGIINSYIVPLLSVPTFFSISIAAALLPNITKLYYKKEYSSFNNKLLKLLIISIVIGIICLTGILLFPKFILNLVYNVTYGINYIYLIAPFFLLLYIQPTLSVALQAMGKTNKLLSISIITISFKYTLLFILAKQGYGINSLLYAMISGLIITTSLMIISVLKELRFKS